MYKKRFAAWGFAKNKRRTRKANADTTSNVIVKGDARRKEIQSSLPQDKQIPMSCAGMPFEDILYSIAAWMDGGFQGFHNALSNAYEIYPSTRVSQELSLANALIDRNEGQLAGMAIRKAFWQFGDVLTVGDPALLRNMVDMIVCMLRCGGESVLRTMLLYLASLATQRLPKLHPLVHFFQQLVVGKVDVSELTQGMQTVHECTVDKLNKRLHQCPQWMWDSWIWNSCTRTMDTDPDKDLTQMMDALQSLDLNNQQSSETLCERESRDSLAGTELESMKYHVADRISLSNIPAMPEGQLEMTLPASDQSSKWYLGRLKIKAAVDQHDWQQAIQLVHAKVEKLEVVCGPNSLEIVRELWSLEKVVRKSGKFHEADQLANDAMARITQYLSEVQRYL